MRPGPQGGPVPVEGVARVDLVEEVDGLTLSMRLRGELDMATVPPFQQIATAYMKAHPDVHIELQNSPWSAYFTKLDAQLAAGAGPDVFFITNVPTYAARNQLEDLGPWIKKTDFPIDEYNQNSLKIHSLNGKLYSIPRDNGTEVLYYNKDDFDQAGIKYPDASWKWADLEAAAIEAGANEFEPLSHAQNDDIPEGHAAARFLTERAGVHAAATWLKNNGWAVITAELGYIAKMFPELDDTQRGEVGEFLQALEDHDDVQRVWAAVK